MLNGIAQVVLAIVVLFLLIYFGMIKPSEDFAQLEEDFKFYQHYSQKFYTDSSDLRVIYITS